jgi:DNA-binding transcriptional LysR family regulator
MLDGVSLDQLRTFIAAADEGSFSAAGRRLRRAQSVVSQTLANLEGQLGVRLFDRAARRPLLTDQGRALLANAREVAGDMDRLKARAKGMAAGLEPELGVVADVMFPIAPITHAVVDFQKRFPATALKLYMEGRCAVVRAVLERRSPVGIMASLSPAPPALTSERLLSVQVAMVVSPQHPLARYRTPIPTIALAEHLQLVHTDRSDRQHDRELGLLSPRTWLLAHLEAKLAFLRAGFGFAFMPHHVVEADLASGALVQIEAEDAPPEGHVVAMSAIYRTDSPPGPAGRWLIDQLKQEDALPLQPQAFMPTAYAMNDRRQSDMSDSLERSRIPAPYAVPHKSGRAIRSTGNE